MNMSKYENQIGDEQDGAVCPYCKTTHHIEGEDYSEDVSKIECSCGKSFYCSQQINIQHDSYPNCELNGEEHQYEAFGKGCFRCIVCGEVTLNL